MKQLVKPKKENIAVNDVHGYVECSSVLCGSGSSLECDGSYSKDCGVFSRSSVADDEEIIF